MTALPSSIEIKRSRPSRESDQPTSCFRSVPSFLISHLRRQVGEVAEVHAGIGACSQKAAADMTGWHGSWQWAMCNGMVRQHHKSRHRHTQLTLPRLLQNQPLYHWTVPTMSGFYQQAYPTDSQTSCSNVAVHNGCTVNHPTTGLKQTTTTTLPHIQYTASYRQDRQGWTKEDNGRQG